MAVAISALRVVYDQEETHWTRIMLESLICGALSLTAGPLLRRSAITRTGLYLQAG